MTWIDEESFEFWMPAQALKIEKSGDGKSTKRWIQGIASTSSRDLQGEVVVQRGIDFSYFLKHGYFNDDHKNGSEFKVGEPTECKITRDGLWVKGFLYENKKSADDIWEHITALSSTVGARRKMGFSIQGKVKRRNGNVIDSCWIQDIAITPAPVNTTTWAEIAKSLSAQKWDLNKDKDNAEDEEKALEANSVLVPESLEGAQKKKEETTKKSLNFSEAVDYIKQQTNMTQEGAEATAQVIFSLLEE